MITRHDELTSLCQRLPRKHDNVFQAWFYERNGYEMICVQLKRQQPRYLAVTNMPLSSILTKLEEMLCN